MATAPRRVVVTGLGAITPLGLDVQSFWDGMMRGQSGAAPITHFDASAFDTQFACEVKDFDPTRYLDRKLARRLDPFCQFALVAAQQAVADSGIDFSAFTDQERARAGVVFGSGIGGMQVFSEQTQVLLQQGPNRLSPFFIPMLIVDMAPGLISMQYGLRGPNYAIVSACATGNNNIGDAFMLIQRGTADVMVSGGSEASVTQLGVGGFTAMKAMSTRNDTPATASRPFDSTRDGFVLGEGAGALVLESLDHARARGARIYAELIGVGMSADAHHMTAPHPEGVGAALGMQNALEDAGIGPGEVDYLNMHGTSTPLGDVAETNAIKEVFGQHAYEMSLSSTKSMTGHLLGAAGAVEAIASILAITHNTVPPTINFEHPDPACDLDYTFHVPRQRDVRVAASNAFGFGGHNTTVVFRRYED